MSESYKVKTDKSVLISRIKNPESFLSKSILSKRTSNKSMPSNSSEDIKTTRREVTFERFDAVSAAKDNKQSKLSGTHNKERLKKSLNKKETYLVLEVTENMPPSLFSDHEFFDASRQLMANP